MATLLFGGAEPYMQIIVEGLNQEEKFFEFISYFGTVVQGVV